MEVVSRSALTAVARAAMKCQALRSLAALWFILIGVNVSFNAGQGF